MDKILWIGWPDVLFDRLKILATWNPIPAAWNFDLSLLRSNLPKLSSILIPIIVSLNLAQIAYLEQPFSWILIL